MKLRSSVWLSASLLILLSTLPVRAGGRLTAVATFSILADMAQHVGGDRVSVSVLAGPEQDAHVFEPSPQAAQLVSQAQVLITNGLGFEGWIARLQKSSGFKGELVVASRGVVPLKSSDTNDAVPTEDTDPHAWQDMSNALTYVENIRQGLCAADSAGCETYTRNARRYSEDISTLHDSIKSRIGTLPADQRKVITTHDAFGYFAAAYGVRFLAPIGISTESEASAKDVARLIDQVRREKVTALFVETISDRRLIEQIAHETGVKIGPPIYSDALSQPDGPAATYLDMMRYNAMQLIGAMSGS